MRKVIERSHFIQLSFESSLDVGWGLISHHSRLSELHYSSVCCRMCCSWCFLPTKNAFRQFNTHSVVDNWFNCKSANPFLSVYTLVNKLMMNWLLIIHCCMSFHASCFPKHRVTIFVQMSFRVSRNMSLNITNIYYNYMKLKTFLITILKQWNIAPTLLLLLTKIKTVTLYNITFVNVN